MDLDAVERSCRVCGASGSTVVFVRGRNTCKPCSNAYKSAWKKHNPDKVAVHKVNQQGTTLRNEIRRRARAAGIDQDFAVAYYTAHSGLCDICEEPRGKKDLAFDHDHSSGAFRGMLCTNCNQGLGRFRDRPDLLRSAIAYLAQTPVTPGDLDNLKDCP